MEEQKITLGQTLRIIINKVGNIAVPVREKEIWTALDDIASDLYECIVALEKYETDRREADKEAAEDV